MSPTFKSYLAAARLRTLPLSVSGILAGSAIANEKGFFSGTIFVFALLTTICFQVLSNFANDYGDGVKGTDANRKGEARMVASGAISAENMKMAVWAFSVLSAFFSFLTLFSAFGSDYFVYYIVFTVLAALSILSAIKYTVGKSAYGYKGLGDVFVFVFFGLVAVAGSCFLYTKNLSNDVWLPATTIGLLSVAVLNLNNMRDMETDKDNNKMTLALALGAINVKVYHTLLIVLAGLLAVVYVILSEHHWYWLCLPAFIPQLIHLNVVNKIKDLSNLDPELKKVALSTFLFALMMFVLSFFSS